MMKYTWLKVCESNSWCNNCIFGSWSKKSAVVSSILQYYKNTHRKWKSDTQQEIQSQSPKQNRSCAYTVMTYHGHTLWHHQTGFKLLVVVFIKRYCTDRFLKYFCRCIWDGTTVLKGVHCQPVLELLGRTGTIKHSREEVPSNYFWIGKGTKNALLLCPFEPMTPLTVVKTY